MVDPKTAVNSVMYAIQQDGTWLTEIQDIITHEPDFDVEDTTLSSPFITLWPIDVPRSAPHDTDFVGYVTDANGDKTGRKFQATFTAQLQIDIYVAGGDDTHDPSKLGHELWRVLRPYDDHNEGKPLPDDTGSPIDDITHFTVGDGTRADDLTLDPNGRRWRHEAAVEFKDVVETMEQTIEVVEIPRDDEMTGGTSVAIEYQYP